MRKTISLLLIICMGMSLLAGCGADVKPSETTPPASIPAEKDPVSAPLENDDPVEGNEQTEMDKTSVFSAADIDMYGKINQDSPYVAGVVHNGNLEYTDWDYANKTYIAVYDIQTPVGETTMLSDKWEVALSGRFPYGMALGSETGMFSALINNTDCDNGDVSFSIVGEYDAENDYYHFSSNEYSVITTSNKNYVDEYSVYGDNWKMSLFGDEPTGFISILIGENDSEYVYMQTHLNTPVTKTEDVVDIINQALANNEVKQTLFVLEDTEDIGAAQKIVGKDYDLNEVSFLQDILAQKVSNLYGLNLRNKDMEIHLDSDYLRYKGYAADGEFYGVVFNYFAESMALYSDVVADGTPETFFEYTSSNGAKYSYFASGAYVYVYKNEEMVGFLETNTENGFDALNALFGIHP